MLRSRFVRPSRIRRLLQVPATQWRRIRSDAYHRVGAHGGICSTRRQIAPYRHTLPDGSCLPPKRADAVSVAVLSSAGTLDLHPRSVRFVLACFSRYILLRFDAICQRTIWMIFLRLANRHRQNADVQHRVDLAWWFLKFWKQSSILLSQSKQ